MADNTFKRLFFALWPEDRLRDRLDELSRQLARGGGKRVRRENLHITLFFLGAVDPQRRDCLESMADAIRTRPFTLNLDRVSWWSRSRVLLAEPSESPAELHDLVSQLRPGCQGCGFEPERRPFRAHLTLARKVPRALPSRDIEPLAWLVGSFSLVESKTLPAGAQYTILRSWQLG